MLPTAQSNHCHRTGKAADDTGRRLGIRVRMKQRKCCRKQRARDKVKTTVRERDLMGVKMGELERRKDEVENMNVGTDEELVMMWRTHTVTKKINTQNYFTIQHTHALYTNPFIPGQSLSWLAETFENPKWIKYRDLGTGWLRYLTR